MLDVLSQRDGLPRRGRRQRRSADELEVLLATTNLCMPTYRKCGWCCPKTSAERHRRCRALSYVRGAWMPIRWRRTGRSWRRSLRCSKPRLSLSPCKSTHTAPIPLRRATSSTCDRWSHTESCRAVGGKSLRRTRRLASKWADAGWTYSCPSTSGDEAWPRGCLLVTGCLLVKTVNIASVNVTSDATAWLRIKKNVHSTADSQQLCLPLGWNETKIWLRTQKKKVVLSQGNRAMPQLFFSV